MDNFMDRGSWWASVHGVAQSWAQLKRLSMCVCMYIYVSIRICIYAAAAKSLQSFLTLCDPIEGNSPGSPVRGILQARTMEWVSISFSSA